VDDLNHGNSRQRLLQIAMLPCVRWSQIWMYSSAEALLRDDLLDALPRSQQKRPMAGGTVAAISASAHR